MFISLNKYRHAICTLFRNGLSLTLKPLLRQLVVVKEVVCLIPDLSMVVIHPLDFGVAQERWFNEVTTDGCHGNVFKAEPLLVTELVGRVDLATHNNVYENRLVLVRQFRIKRLTLNANAKLAVLVVAGLWENVSVLIQVDAYQGH